MRVVLSTQNVLDMKCTKYHKSISGENVNRKTFLFTQLRERLKTQFTIMRKTKQTNSRNSTHYDKMIVAYYAIA